jgi:hypothetical protein
MFEIYPAIYEGEDQQLYIGPNIINDTAYTAKQYNIPKNITIKGITVNGFRPVIKLPETGASNNTLGQSLIYIDKSENITIENIDISASNYKNGGIGKAGIYINGTKNLTLKNIRVSGFKNKSANGIFATNNNTGILLIESVELDDNGGGGGPEHNIYINASNTDPGYTVKMISSWSHNSYFGHLFKSRAQKNILEGNYFQGSRSTGPNDMRESWLVDIPEGGTLIAKNNIFVKNFSGDNTNGAAITYGVEKTIGSFDMNRQWQISIEHNTFVSFSRFYDTQNHENYPLYINKNSPIKNQDKNISKNIYIGYCKLPSTTFGNSGYLGENFKTLGFNDIDKSYRPRVPILENTSEIIGTKAYQHKLSSLTRKTTAIGAKD